MTFANTLLRLEIPGLGSSLGQNPVLGASVDDANRLTCSDVLLYGNQRALLGPFAQYWETQELRPAADDFLYLQ